MENYNLLDKLNDIVDFIIGNENIMEVGSNEKVYLPEVLAFLESDPDDTKNAKKAIELLRQANGKINHLIKVIEGIISDQEFKNILNGTK